MLLVEHIGQGATGSLGLCQRSDSAFAQLRQQCQENPCTSKCVAKRGMAIGDVDTEPGGQAVERVAGEIRLCHFGKKPRIERARA